MFFFLKVPESTVYFGKFVNFCQFCVFFGLWWQLVERKRIQCRFLEVQIKTGRNRLERCCSRGLCLYRREILRWLRIFIDIENRMASFCAIVKKRSKYNHFETKKADFGHKISALCKGIAVGPDTIAPRERAHKSTPRSVWGGGRRARLHGFANANVVKKERKSAKKRKKCRFWSILAPRGMRLLGNYCADAGLASGEVVGAYAPGCPVSSARQMFLPAWESAFPSQKKDVFYALANNFTGIKDTPIMTTDMSSRWYFPSGRINGLMWKRKCNPNLDLQKKYCSKI